METNVSLACVALKGGKILVAKRIARGDMGGRWEFPGGKAEEGESDGDAIVREMREEFGVDVQVGAKIAEGSFVHKGRRRILRAYEVSLAHDGIEKPFALTEHDAYEWIEVEKIKSLDFVDSDLSIYPQVSEHCAKSAEAR